MYVCMYAFMHGIIEYVRAVHACVYAHVHRRWIRMHARDEHMQARQRMHAQTNRTFTCKPARACLCVCVYTQNATHIQTSMHT